MDTTGSPPAEDEVATAARDVSKHTNLAVLWVAVAVLSLLVVAMSLPRGIAMMNLEQDRAWSLTMIAIGAVAVILTVFSGLRAGLSMSRRTESRKRLDRAVAVATEMSD